MTTDPIIVIQTQPDMPPGLLAAWARATAQPLDVRRVDLGDPLPEPRGSVVILGSDASVHDRSVALAVRRARLDRRRARRGHSRAGNRVRGAAPRPPARCRRHRSTGGRPRWTTVESTEPWLPPAPGCRGITTPSGRQVRWTSSPATTTASRRSPPAPVVAIWVSSSAPRPRRRRSTRGRRAPGLRARRSGALNAQTARHVPTRPPAPARCSTAGRRARACWRPSASPSPPEPAPVDSRAP